MNGQGNGKICLNPIPRFCYFKVLFDNTFYHKWGKETCLLYLGLHCVEVRYIEVSPYSFHREISGINPHPLPTSCLEPKLSCLTFLERFYPLKNNVNPSLLDFLFSDPPMCSHIPPPPLQEKEKDGREPSCHFPFFSSPGGGVFWVGRCSHKAINLHGGVGMDIF